MKSPGTVQKTVSMLQKKQYVKQADYQRLYTVCSKVTGKIYKQYKMNDIVYKPNLRDEIIEDITVMSLAKALKTYDPTRNTQFLSYYYNKVRSSTRVHQNKCYKRQALLNAYSIEAYEERNNDKE